MISPAVTVTVAVIYVHLVSWQTTEKELLLLLPACRVFIIYSAEEVLFEEDIPLCATSHHIIVLSLKL